MSKWLVTGATGLLGLNAGLHLSPHAETVGLCRNPKPLPGYQEVRKMDILDSQTMRSAIHEIRPDVVLHTAAIAGHEACEQDPDLAFATNVTASRELAKVSAEVGAVFVYISTDAVFDGKYGSYTEIDSVNPFSVYGMTKFLGEEAALEENPKTIVVRTNFFGWSSSGRRSILEFFVNSLRNRTLVNGYTDFRVTSIYAPQLIEIICKLVDIDYTGRIHIASSDSKSKYEFGMMTAKTFNLPPTLILPVESASGGHATGRHRDLSLNTNLAAQVIGGMLPRQEEGVYMAMENEISIKEKFMNRIFEAPTD